MRIRHLSLALAVVLSVPTVTAVASADEPTADPSAQLAAQTCDAAVADHGGDDWVSTDGAPRLCASFAAGADAAAHICRWLGTASGTAEEGVLDADTCARLGGIIIDDRFVADYRASAVATAHADQRAATRDVALRDAFVLSTHNSFNHARRRPALSGLDANQHYSLVDQLDMDIRGLELDVHAFPSVEGGGVTPIMCHGGVGPWGHEGCSVEEPFVDALTELRAWFDAHPGEVVILEIEDHLDGDAGQTAAIDAIESVLGSGSDRDLIHRPGDVFTSGVADGDCVGLPMDLTLGQVADAGKQVLLFSGCGNAGWNSNVFSNDGGVVGGVRSRNGQLGADERAALTDPIAPCPSGEGWAANWVRFHQDATWVSYMAGASEPAVTASELAGSARCGYNMPSLDLVHPHDERLAAALFLCTDGSFAATHAEACAQRDAAVA